MKGISIPSCALLGRRWAFPCQGTSEPALRLPACLSVWFRKTSPKKPGRRQVQRQGGKNFFFFLQGVCVPVCVSILSGGCPHLCSFQKFPDAVPRAYKASFSIRKETAVKAADGLALRGPELGLITLLLPGMILVVSYDQAGEGRKGTTERMTVSRAGLEQKKGLWKWSAQVPALPVTQGPLLCKARLPWNWAVPRPVPRKRGCSPAWLTPPSEECILWDRGQRELRAEAPRAPRDLLHERRGGKSPVLPSRKFFMSF